MHRGYIKIWRKLEDSGLLQMHGTLALFVYMLMQASHKPIRYGMETVDRGQLISGRHKLSEAVGLSEQQLRTCIEKLHNLEMITSKPTNKYTLYTIVNYGQYQDCEDVTNQQINQQATNNQPTNNQQVTTIQTHKHINTKEVKAISSPKGSRLSPDWKLPMDWGNWALQEKQGCNAEDIRKCAERFKDYWISVAGAKGVKADWQATWRTWVRRDNEIGTRPASRLSEKQSEVDRILGRKPLEIRNVIEND